MGNLNLTWVNVLKSNYLNVLDYYENEKEQLKDGSVARCHEALLVVESAKQWGQWRRMGGGQWSVLQQHGCREYI